MVRSISVQSVKDTSYTPKVRKVHFILVSIVNDDHLVKGPTASKLSRWFWPA